MNVRFQVIAAILVGLAVPSISFLQADPHGHIFHRDQEGHCIQDNDDNDDGCCNDVTEEACHHRWVHEQKKIEPGFEDEDLSYEVDRDASWPSRRENFAEMFR